MAEWKGVRFYRTEAESMKDEPFTSIVVDIKVNGVRRRSKDELEIDFDYNVDYKEDVAKLLLRGRVTMSGKEKELDKYVESWRSGKKLPKELGAPLASIINFSSEVNGVLVARALNMPAPIIPPNIKFGK